MDTANRKFRWKRWLLVVLVLLVLFVISAPFIAKQVVQSQLNRQLQQLELGEAEIGRLSLGLNGIDLTDIRVLHPDEETPWLDVRRINVNHSILGLLGGAHIDEIEIDGIDLSLDLDRFAQMPSSEFSLSDIQLPAKRIKLGQANIQLLQENRTPLPLRGLSGVLDETENGLVLDGGIENLISGKWELDGTISGDDFAFNVASQNAKLENGVWQKWPGLPDVFEQVLEAEADFEIEANVTSQDGTSFSYDGLIRLEQAELNLPTFDLPIDVQSGKIRFENGKVNFQAVEAVLDGEANLVGSGTTTISQFPVVTTYEAKFEQLNTNTLRKIVADLPDELVGTADGTVTGSVAVDDEFVTTVALSSVAKSQNAKYAKLNSSESTTKVELDSLVLDDQMLVQSITGHVRVNSSAFDEPMASVFETFELNGLAEQLQLFAKGSGTLMLDIPLATADSIETWKMVVDGKSETGTISKMPLADMTVKATMVDGWLTIKPTTRLISQEASNGRGRLEIRWPLTENINQQVGTITLTGESMPPTWLLNFGMNQLFPAADPAATNDLIGQSNLSGSINATGTYEIPIETPDQVETWIGTSKIYDSTIAANNAKLTRVVSEFALANGLLNISEFTGAFDSGGLLTASAAIDVIENAKHAAKIQGTEMPLAWLASVARSTMPELDKSLPSLSIANDEPAGKLSATVDLNIQPDSPWEIKLKVASPELTLNKQKFSDLDVGATIRDNLLSFETARLSFANRGKASLAGKLNLENGGADGILSWTNVPINALTSLMMTGPGQTAGSTSGNISVESVAPLKPDSLPIKIKGKTSVNGFQVGTIRTRDISFELDTRDGVVFVDELKNDGMKSLLELHAELALSRPYAFDVRADLNQVSLANIFALPSVTEQIGLSEGIEGIADGEAHFLGNLEQFSWATRGDIKVADPSYGDSRLSDIDAQWKFSPADSTDAMVEIHALGGTVKSTRLDFAEQRIEFEMVNLHPEELSAFSGSGSNNVRSEGEISGTVYLSDWDRPDQDVVAHLDFHGASITAGITSVGDISADINLKNKRLDYEVGGKFVDGTLLAMGEVRFEELGELMEKDFPLNVRLDGGAIDKLYGAEMPRSQRPLLGSISANLDLNAKLGAMPTGEGKLRLGNLSWNNHFVAAGVDAEIELSENSIAFEHIRAKLRRGEAIGRARLPLNTVQSGDYRFDFRNLEIKRLAESFLKEPLPIDGSISARVSGKVGAQLLSGDGTLTFSNLNNGGRSRGGSIKVPMKFAYEPDEQTGKVELRQGQIRMFKGLVSGKAELAFGNQLNLDVDLKLSNIDTEQAVGGFVDQVKGKLDGRVVLNGRAIKTTRDLNGSFTGRLRQSSPFTLPILSELSSFLSVSQLSGNDFDTDEIDIRLHRDKLDINQLNINNSLAKVSISGRAYMDSRLELEVAGRIDTFNEPTLLELVGGSPLTRFSTNEAAFFAQAADFLATRLVFAKVGGTVNRPQIRLNPGKQLREETIRYFLRGSQILPIANR